jgi:predicted nucleotidyltransferase
MDKSPPTNPAKIHEICRRYPIRRLALFGSALRDDFGSESDIDLLVEWVPDAFVGFRVFDLEREQVLNGKSAARSLARAQ